MCWMLSPFLYSHAAPTLSPRLTQDPTYVDLWPCSDWAGYSCGHWGPTYLGGWGEDITNARVQTLINSCPVSCIDGVPNCPPPP